MHLPVTPRTGVVLHPEDVMSLFDVLYTAARQSPCGRGGVGAALIDPAGTIVYSDTNRPLPTDPNCLAHCDREERCRHTVHAEMWCLHAAANRPEPPHTWTLAATAAPCYRCAQLIALSGIRTVLYLHPYRDPAGLQILARAGVNALQIHAPRG